jgi:ribosomal protein S6
MSTEQQLNNDLIEQTKQQIRALVNEIAQLSKSDITPEEFYNEFLTRVVSALAAVGGVVWTIEEQGRMALQYQINLQQTGLQHDEEMQKQHGQLLRQTLTSGEPILVPPHSGSAPGEDQIANPTEFLLVMGPIKTDLETVGLIEIFQRPDSGINTQKGYLRFLSQMCDLAADFMKSRQLRHFSDRQVMWSRLEDFTRTIHGSLDSRLTAYTIANEGRRLIECDRVSIALRKGKKCRIEAISGQDTFDKRSNTVRLLGELATRVVEVNEPIWYTGDTSNMAPQIEDAIHDYVDESHSKTVAVLPLLRPEPPE